MPFLQHYSCFDASEVKGRIIALWCLNKGVALVER